MRVVFILALGNAIWISECEQQTNLIGVVLPMRTSRTWKLSMPQVGSACHSSTGDAIDCRTGRVIVLFVQDIQAEPQIGVPPAGGSPQNISFAEESRHFTGKTIEL